MAFANATRASDSSLSRQQRLYLRPEPQRQGSLRPSRATVVLFIPNVPLFGEEAYVRPSESLSSRPRNGAVRTRAGDPVESRVKRRYPWPRKADRSGTQESIERLRRLASRHDAARRRRPRIQPPRRHRPGAVLSWRRRAGRRRPSQSGRILVVFEWFGGNDGLNTIVPYGDPMYYKHRPTIGIKEKDVLTIDAHVGWHKSMSGMKRLYDEGKVAIVQGVGYDRPSFSHFSSMSFWHTAAPNSGHEYGWIGRTASALDPAGARQNMIVNVADSQTLAVKAEKHVPLVFVDPTRFQRGVFAQEKAALDMLSAQHAPVGDAHKYVLEVTRSAAQASEVVRAAWSRTKARTTRICGCSTWTRWRR